MISVCIRSDAGVGRCLLHPSFISEVEGDEKEPTLLLKKIEVFPSLVWSKTSYHTCTVCSQSVTTLLADVRAYYSYHVAMLTLTGHFRVP